MMLGVVTLKHEHKRIFFVALACCWRVFSFALLFCFFHYLVPLASRSAILMRSSSLSTLSLSISWISSVVFFFSCFSFLLLFGAFFGVLSLRLFAFLSSHSFLRSVGMVSPPPLPPPPSPSSSLPPPLTPLPLFISPSITPTGNFPAS